MPPVRKLGILLPSALVVAFMLACGSYSPRATPQPTREPEPTFTPLTLMEATAAPPIEPTQAPVQLAPTATIAAPAAPVEVPTATSEPARAAPVVEVDVQTPTTNDVANVRSGPGTEHATVGSVAAGQPLTIVGRNAAGDWYQLGDGNWIAAFLVTGAPADLPVIEVAPVAAPAVTPVVEQPTAAPVVVAEPTNPPFTCVGGCAQAPDPSCAIKGNVNSSGDRIYHTTDSRSYNNTNVNPEEGDRWFCTTAEAEAAGFRAPLN